MSFWGALGGAVANSPFISAAQDVLAQGVFTGNWGGTSKERKNAIHDERFMRRRVYQDQMHSMKEAGLNPMLAAGATPPASHIQQPQAMDMTRHAAAYQTANAQTRASAVKERLAPSEVRQAEALAREAEARADTAEATRDAQVALLRAQRGAAESSARSNNASAALDEGPHMASAEERVRTQAAETDLKKREAQLTTIKSRVEELHAQGIASDNVSKEAQARWILQHDDLLQAGKTVEEIWKILGPIPGLIGGAAAAKALLKRLGRLPIRGSGRVPNIKRRESGANAQEGSRLPVPSQPRGRILEKAPGGGWVDKQTGEWFPD